MKHSISKVPQLLCTFLLLAAAWSCNDDVRPAQQNATITKDQKTGPVSSAGRIGNHDFWYFFRGSTNDYLYYAYSDDGVTWSGNTRLGSDTTPCSPAAVYFNNRFIVASRGKTNPYIYINTSSDGITWQSGGRLSTAITTLTTPSFAVVNNTLYLFYAFECTSCAEFKMIKYVYSTDGTTWSSPTTINTLSGNPQTFAPFTTTVNPATQEIHFFYRNGAVDDQMLYTFKSNVSTSKILTFGLIDSIDTGVGCNDYELQMSDAAPAAAFLNGTLYLARKATIYETSYDLHILKRNPTGCPEWTNVYTANNQQSTYTPSMTSQGGKLVLIYVRYGSTNIYRGTSTNGTTWSFGAAIGQGQHGGPTVIGG